MIAVRVQGLQRSYGPKKVLEDIHFEIKKGKAAVIFGDNGSGKTTLLRILSTLLTPTSGEAWVCGHSVTRQSQKVRESISWIPATDQGFIPRFTGIENLKLIAALEGVKWEVAWARIERWRSFPVFDQALKTPFYLCSAGMKQVLRVSRILIKTPDVLLMDEPTRSLDEHSTSFVKELVAEELLSGSEARGRTLLFSTHARDALSEIATQTLKLKNGMVQ